MPIKNWSTTPGSNTSAPPNGAPESSTKIKDFNDIARQIMADTRYLCSAATVASAATTDLGASDETFLTVSGTTTITAFGTVSAGIYKFVTFSGALTLTHNATSLILLGGANRTTVAGDCGLYLSLGSGNWKEYFYSTISATSYQPLDDQLTTLAGITAQQATDLASLSTFMGTVLNDADEATARATLGAKAAYSRAYAEYVLYNGFTGVIPGDDTIPQNTEGDEIVTVSITPKLSTSRLRVRVNVHSMTTNGALSVVGALFRDTTANAVKSGVTKVLAAGDLAQFQLDHEEASGSTAATTFKFRMGCAAAGTFWVNGSSTARLFGGTSSVSIVVEEV